MAGPQSGQIIIKNEIVSRRENLQAKGKFIRNSCQQLIGVVEPVPLAFHIAFCFGLCPRIINYPVSFIMT